MNILTPFCLLNTIIILHLKTVYNKNIVSTSVMRRKPSVSVNNHPLVSILHHPLGIYNSAVSGLWVGKWLCSLYCHFFSNRSLLGRFWSEGADEQNSKMKVLTLERPECLFEVEKWWPTLFWWSSCVIDRKCSDMRVWNYTSIIL